MDELSTINLNLNGTTPNNKVRHLHFPSYIRRRIPAADYYRKRVVRLHDLKIDAMKGLIIV
jgi:hypothetical protein